MFKRFLLVFSLGVSLVAVTFFNIERNSIYIGGTHYHGSAPETGSYVSADRNIDKPENDGADVVHVTASPDTKPLSIDVIAISPEVVISISTSDDKITSHSEDQQTVFIPELASLDSKPFSLDVRAESPEMYISVSAPPDKITSYSEDQQAQFLPETASLDSKPLSLDVRAESPEVYITVSTSPDKITHVPEKKKSILAHIPLHLKTKSAGRLIQKFADLVNIVSASSPDHQTQQPSSPDKIVSPDPTPEPFSFTGYLKSRNDSNTFTFALDSACAVNISFTPSDGDKAYYILSVHDSAGNTLTRKTIDSEKSYSDSGRLYLNAGKYTLKIQRGYSWSGKTYTLNVNTSHSADTESEPNNSPHTANTIPVNQDIPASSGTRNDTDYFAFTLDKPSSVTPSLKFNPVRFSKGIYRFKLYGLEILDTGKKPFIFRGDGTPSRKIKPFILEAGTYIISISRTESEELELGLHEYTLRVEAQEF